VIHFDIPGCQSRIKELEEEMNDPSFWNDLERSQKVNKEIKILKNKIQKYNDLQKRMEDIEVMIELGMEEQDISLVAETLDEFKS